ARMEFERALAVAARQVPTVCPLAFGERATGLGPGDSYLITRSLEGTEPLDHFIDGAPERFDMARQVHLRRRLAVELGRFMARMHDTGIVHNDLHPGNLLLRFDVEDQPQLF